MTALQDRTLEDEIRHSGVYDPVKAHQYYLSRRQLKGRRRGSNADVSSRPGGQGDQGGTGGSSNAALRDSRREKLEVQIAELQAKVDQLRNLLRIRVAEAKKRAGVKEDPKDKKDAKTTKDTKETSKKESKDSKDKPLTEKQKADKRKASKEQYEKENGTSLARQADALQETIKSIRAKLDKLPKPANNAQSEQKAQSDTKRRDGR